MTIKSEKGGRPNCDVILMFKILILRQWLTLKLKGKWQIESHRTIWLFKERMAKTQTDVAVWAELQRQLDSMGLEVKRGTIQDATFIEADPGQFKKPRGKDAKTRRSRDGHVRSGENGRQKEKRRTAPHRVNL
jgi:IS5 family transposase